MLDNLKNDPSEYVRRSVANSLNDISKDNADIVIEIAQQWKSKNIATIALIKHGCRTLLKQGNTDILHYFDLNDLSGLTPRRRLWAPLIPIEFA